MLIKNIYFVRHGETLLNESHIRQGEAGSLSENGKTQAGETGKRLRQFDIQKIFCSPFTRARETADIINGFLGVREIEYIPLLGERRNPSEIIGKKYDDPVTIQAINFMDKSFHREDARFSDEENFEDLKNRALKLKNFLIKNSKDNTLCITHGIFLKMFLCVLIYDEKLTVEQYIKLTVFNPADNAGITVVQYNPMKFFSNPFEIIAYNDSPISKNNLKI
jgi:broad specificity phosphatase PhoE